MGSYAVERSVSRDGSGANRRGGRARAAGAATGVVALALGALLFAGSLAGEDRTAWPGALAGVLCAALAYVAVSTLLDRAGRRLDSSAAAFLTLYADAAALALAAVAIFLPPVSFLALSALAWLIAGSRRERARKYEGLRVLR